MNFQQRHLLKQYNNLWSALAVAGAAGLASAGGAVGAGAGAGSGNTGLNGRGAASIPTTFWRFVEALQIINYMLYLAVDSPDVLHELYKILSLTNGDFMPDAFGYFVKPTGIDPPTPFAV